MIEVTEGFTRPAERPYMKEHTTPDYYVIFWENRSLPVIEEYSDGEGDHDLEYRLRRAYRLSGCASVEEAIEWENNNAKGRESATLLPVLNESGDTDTLYVLHGHYSTEEEVNPDELFGWTLYRPDDAPPAT
ncbi:hypothetical protein KRX51_07780 [Corynebacterium sp. TAE3-ERU12]|uniref:hypothetical protein n=1 Tax=Corynebacterium sp. TAE3-ERU12 TaxID=2849491 RepID=UPI001C4920B6|nr:hypothetical protein [Corynebacterium sp. TAE3-ERU12]MBV7295810.1 hypothetical protein [Corynebacterium sp. TAE3-ERU12]